MFTSFKKFILLLFVFSLLISGCTATSTETDQSQSNTNNAEGEESVQEEADFTIDMKNFSFTPSSFEVEAGTTVTVKIINSSGSHDFVIDELNVNSGLTGSGQELTFAIEVPEDASGESFAYYCSVSNHRSLGMEGTLIVK